MSEKNKWSRVSILTALLDEVNILIENKPRLGYPSASSFVNDAVRRLLERCQDRTGENGVRNTKTIGAPLKATVNSQQAFKTFWKEAILTTAGELQVEVDPKNLDKIIMAIAQKLNLQ